MQEPVAVSGALWDLAYTDKVPCEHLSLHRGLPEQVTYVAACCNLSTFMYDEPLFAVNRLHMGLVARTDDDAQSKGKK